MNRYIAVRMGKKERKKKDNALNKNISVQIFANM
jgi:hypothetical protein